MDGRGILLHVSKMYELFFFKKKQKECDVRCTCLSIFARFLIFDIKRMASIYIYIYISRYE